MESRLFQFLTGKEEVSDERYSRHHSPAATVQPGPVYQPSRLCHTSRTTAFYRTTSSHEYQLELPLKPKNPPSTELLRAAGKHLEPFTNAPAPVPCPQAKASVSVCVLTIRKLHTGADLSVNIDHAGFLCSSQLIVVVRFPKVCAKV